VVWNHLASYIILFLIVSSLVFLLGLPIEIKKLAIYNILLFSFWSLTAVIVYYLYTSSPKTDNVNFGIFNTTEFPDDYYDNGNKEFKEDNTLEYISEKYNLLREQLKNIYLKKFPNVFEFLGQNLNLRSYDISECVILRSADTYNVEVIPYQSISLYMNLHELNDIKLINEYFIEINKRLKQNGYFIGRFQSNHLRYHEYHKKYPFYLANLIYSFDFIWKRMFPKLPILKRIFYFLSRGRNRALSMAEGLGRLYYCGFKVKAIQEINGHLYFIARKDKEPSTDINPSYGLFFKMKRVGQFGKTIFVYKMRTMHPYSEYLQKFVHDNFSLKQGGKFEKDFRITSWGRIARKLWIDELPMLINLAKRELKIVGIRPLSFHYLSLYDPKFVEFRNKFKPGLVPPFYADMPKTLDEIQNSEKKYLEKYSKNKFKTDIEYLVKAFKNIFLHKARSA
jgi:lipopolysaccharide/colanic/teichoic acid biosynthesis glycosyltransferase